MQRCGVAKHGPSEKSLSRVCEGIDRLDIGALNVATHASHATPGMGLSLLEDEEENIELSPDLQERLEETVDIVETHRKKLHQVPRPLSSSGVWCLFFRSGRHIAQHE